MKYDVRINDFGRAYGEPLMLGDVIRRRVSLVKARRLATRAARRGVKLYGGTVRNSNWGAVGGRALGEMGATYRSAVITVSS